MTVVCRDRNRTPRRRAFVEKRPLEALCARRRSRRWSACRARRWPTALGEAGVPERQRRMRVQQIWHWLYVRGAQDFDAMTTLVEGAARGAGAALHAGAARNRRRADFRRRHAQMAASAARRDRRRAARGRMRLYSRRPTAARLCISSQVGCTLNCTFCHTGTQRLVRNLTAGEIAGQVVLARDRLNDWQRERGNAGAASRKSASSPTSS